MARTPALVDQHGRPLRKAELTTPRAVPTTGGVRPVISGHPAEGLTPRRLAQIHRTAAEGEPLDYLELAEDIEERDLHYAGVIATRKRAVAQVPIQVEAASDDAAHVEHADFVRSWLKDGVVEAAVFDMLDAVSKGFSVLEIDWQVRRGRFVPRELVYRPQRWFTFDPLDGETVLLREAVGDEPLNPAKFVLHRHKQKSGLTIRSGLARLASWAWMYKAFTLRDWAVFVQNYGQPMRLGRYGPEASDADVDTLWRAVLSIAGDCAAIIPKGMEIEFAEVKSADAGSELYEKRADWLDRQISKAVLGQTTTTDAVSGGHAVAREHRLVQEDIERADCALVGATLNRQLVPLLVALNFGPQDDYPTVRVGRPDETPLAEIVDTLYKLGPQGFTVEASWLRDRIGAPDPAKAGEDGATAELVGGVSSAGRAAPVAESDGQPSRNARDLDALRLVRSRHASAPEPDLVEALEARLAEDADGAMAGLAAAVRAELDAATDLADAGRRLAGLNLDPDALAEAMARGMAVAHLAGEAALLDELKRTR